MTNQKHYFMKSQMFYYLAKRLIVMIISLLCSDVIAQHFYIAADLGAGQATGEYDLKKFAITSDLGVGYETKSRLISLEAKLKTESFNFGEEWDLMVFSLPISCVFAPRINPRPFGGVSLAPCYATQWLIERDFFLSGGLSGGIIYEFPKLSCYARYEYLADITGYSHNQTAIQNVERYHLNRYYISLGVRVNV